MSPRYRARKTLRVGPFRFHFSERGYTGWGMKVWRWSWSSRTGKHRINTPGMGSIELGGRNRQSRPGRRRREGQA